MGPTPPSRFIRTTQVSHGFDVADNEITDRIEVGDLAITADIPLASEVITRAHALNRRGEFYTPDNIAERLALRNYLAGVQSGSVQDGRTCAPRQHGSQTLRGSARRFLTRRRKG